MGGEVQVRRGLPADLPFLERMLFEACHWQTDATRPDFEEYRHAPEFQKMLGGWSERAGDTAAIAESAGQPVGAAWYRFWTSENHSWGFVDAATPEVGIGVALEYRSQGVGRALMEFLIAEARAGGTAALSLSVDPTNFARRLYESLGFQQVGASGTSITLALELDERPMTRG